MASPAAGQHPRPLAAERLGHAAPLAAFAAYEDARGVAADAALTELQHRRAAGGSPVHVVQPGEVIDVPGLTGDQEPDRDGGGFAAGDLAAPGMRDAVDLRSVRIAFDGEQPRLDRAEVSAHRAAQVTGEDLYRHADPRPVVEWVVGFGKIGRQPQR